jgi:hypothetical protein
LGAELSDIVDANDISRSSASVWCGASVSVLVVELRGRVVKADSEAVELAGRKNVDAMFNVTRTGMVLDER